jgi:PREDICTED: similar to ortholog of keratin associated protein 16-1 KRTAP16-1 (homo sapiens)
MMEKIEKVLVMPIIGLFLICFLFGNNSFVAFAHEQVGYEESPNSDILVSVRLSQMGQYFEDFERVELALNNNENTLKDEEVIPCTPASVNPVSICVGSACAGSICVGSGCGVSYCIGSACAGSLCGGSGCGVSNCGGSACAVSVCGGSACGVSGCAGSLCADCRK